jgi:hypothetical protein
MALAPQAKPSGIFAAMARRIYGAMAMFLSLSLRLLTLSSLLSLITLSISLASSKTVYGTDILMPIDAILNIIISPCAENQLQQPDPLLQS